MTIAASRHAHVGKCRSNSRREIALGIIIFCLVLNAGVVGFQLGGPAGARGMGPSAPDVVAEFNIPGDGDSVMIPVLVGGARRLFLVDTGAEETVLDRSLLPSAGAARLEATRQGAGAEEVPTCGCRIAIGGIEFDASATASWLDLAPLRLALGADVRGILGMDFLRQYVVQFDFERRTLRFRTEVPEGIGMRLQLVAGEIRPFVSLQLAGIGAERFLVDTGAGLQVALADDLFNRMLARRTVERRTATEVLTTSGRRTARLAEFSGRFFREFAEHEIVATSHDDGNLLGQRFLARYNVTFDFPGGRLYLQRRTDPVVSGNGWDLSGLDLTRTHTSTIVYSVEPYSAAVRAGFLPDDVILKVFGVPAGAYRLSQIRNFCEAEGRQVTFVVDRDGEEVRLTLNLPRRK